MFRKTWVLALGLALVPAVSLAQKKGDPSSINTYPNCLGVTGNIVSNCGFESGDFTGWIQSGDLSFTGVATYAAHHAGVGSGNQGAFFGPTGGLGCISQAVTTPSFNYDISLWLSNQSQPNEFQVFWNGAAISDWLNAGNSDYQQLSWKGIFTSPATSTLQICFTNPPSYFYLDDIVVVATPGAGMK